ncbi:hypothetical protein D3C87_1894730 [compost metagenome]
MQSIFAQFFNDNLRIITYPDCRHKKTAACIRILKPLHIVDRIAGQSQQFVAAIERDCISRINMLDTQAIVLPPVNAFFCITEYLPAVSLLDWEQA